MSKRLEEELKERLHTRTLEKYNTSTLNSCISKGYCYTIDEEQSIFVKTNATISAPIMFEGELESLKQIINTKTVRVPKPLLVLHDYDDTNASAIVMEFINIKPLGNLCAESLGLKLANLHDYNTKVLKHNKRACKWIGGNPPSVKAIKQARARARGEEVSDESEEIEENQFAKHNMRVKISQPSEEPLSSQDDVPYPDRFVPEPKTREITQFGFEVPTSCGSIPQMNAWTDDWISFYARFRIDKPIRSLLSDHGDRELSEQWSALQLKVDKFFTDFDKSLEEDKITPALLHGDLWSGNIAQLSDGSQGTVYDPSSFYGHSEYDFGIARMFGGIPKSFEESYFKILPKKKLFEKRNKLYQLFHHLNHWDHFGRGYRASSIRLIKELNTLD